MKKGLDYFALQANDPDLEVVGSIFSHQGFRIYCELMKAIVTQEGWFLRWNRNSAILFAKRHNVDQSMVRKVVKFLLKEYDFFDNEIFENHKILTSATIQASFLTMTKRRKRNRVLQMSGIHVATLARLKRGDFVVKDCGVEIVNDKGELVELFEVPVKKGGKECKVKQKEVKDQLNGRIDSSKEELSEPSLEVEELIRLGKEKMEESQTSSYSREQEGEEKKNVALKKKPEKHPARDALVAIWEERMGMKYISDVVQNTAVRQLCKKIEKNILMKTPKMKGNTDLVEQIALFFKEMMDRWGELDNFYQKQVAFTAINKQFENIIYQQRNGVLDSSYQNSMSGVMNGTMTREQMNEVYEQVLN